MKSTCLKVIEFTLLLVGLGIYGLGYLPFPLLPHLRAGLGVPAPAPYALAGCRSQEPRPMAAYHRAGLADRDGLPGSGYIRLFSRLERLTGEAIDLSLFGDLQGNLLLLIIFLAVSWTEAAFVEEMFFHGYLFNRITDLAGTQRIGILIALMATSLVFGAAHAYQGISGVVDTALAGLLLGLLYLYAGGNLWLPILTHGVIDTVGFLIIYFGPVWLIEKTIQSHTHWLAFAANCRFIDIDLRHTGD